MKIYLFRHAQKAIDFSGDPDLTLDGHNQASKLLDKVLKNELPQPTELWVSPKKRTHSTFKPLSRHFGIPLTTQEALLEQQSEETLEQFRKRIENIFEKASKKKDSTIFLCTHYDWVVEAMTVIPCDTDLSTSEFMHWDSCQYVGWNKNSEGLFEFIELKRIQS